MERTVTFESRRLQLEGKLDLSDSSHGAIITHPHPQYGGDMDNAVVETITKAYQHNGWSTLRFNFRGTGNSQGRFDGGIGEQEDVDAAIAYLSSQGVTAIELTGYSYGAFVLAGWAQQTGNHPYPMRLVAPPVAFMDFSNISRLNGLKQVVVGTHDEFAPLSQVERLVPSWNSEARFNVIENTDHFYWNSMDKLQKLLEDEIDQIGT